MSEEINIFWVSIDLSLLTQLTVSNELLSISFGGTHTKVMNTYFFNTS